MSDKPPMMKCGHAANSTSNGKPSCVICFGCEGELNIIVDDSPPDLSQRKARCSYFGIVADGRNSESNYGSKKRRKCTAEQPSGTDLPFFSYQPNKDFDSFYCGCWGWD